jgi:hypothetical protein
VGVKAPKAWAERLLMEVALHNLLTCKTYIHSATPRVVGKDVVITLVVKKTKKKARK